MDLFITYLFERETVWTYFAWILVVMFSICAHELSHALAALRCGDDTAAEAGHLTLDPMVQLGPTSLVVLAIFGIAWGSVPVDVHRLRKKWHAAAVAFAGPAANLILCVLSALLVVLFSGDGDAERANLVARFFELACWANGVLFLFNLLPVPMFDGWTVFSLFVPAMRRVDLAKAQTMGWMFLLVVFVTPVGSFVWLGGEGIGRFMVNGWQVALAAVGLG